MATVAGHPSDRQVGCQQTEGLKYHTVLVRARSNGLAHDNLLILT